jgi:hypothetical protein
MPRRKVKDDLHRQRVRMLDDRPVKPCMYGIKKFMTGVVDGEIVRDSKGNPMDLNKIGNLV